MPHGKKNVNPRQKLLSTDHVISRHNDYNRNFNSLAVPNLTLPEGFGLVSSHRELRIALGFEGLDVQLLQAKKALTADGADIINNYC
jgi:hypothetical protein